MKTGKISPVSWHDDDGKVINAHVMIMDIYPEPDQSRALGWIVSSNKLDVYAPWLDVSVGIADPGGLVAMDYED